MLNVLVVDDEAPARDELTYLLSHQAGVQVIGEADSGLAAIRLAVEHRPDVVFLDVQMRGMNGLEAAVALRAALPEILIVFATAYDEYAIRAFEVGAVDYMLKPFEQERVHATIKRLEGYRKEGWHEAGERVDAALAKNRVNIQKIPVIQNGKIRMVNYTDVIYAIAQGGSVGIVANEGKYEYGGTLTELEERLRGTTFVRVHKSYIVNMSKVKEIVPWFKGTYWLKMEDCLETEIPVSKSQIKEVKDIFGLR